MYRISKEAQHDLEKIWAYTFETWSVQQADRYIQLIFDEIEYIAKHPNNGKDFSFLRKGYLRTKVKSHFIFYRINNSKTIDIVRILHEQMDIENRL